MSSLTRIEVEHKILTDKPVSFEEFADGLDCNINEAKSLEGDKALEAVKQNGFALQYVHNQTPEVCLEAVKQDSDALQYVRNQTPKICLEAVKQNVSSFCFIDRSIFQNSNKEVL